MRSARVNLPAGQKDGGMKPAFERNPFQLFIGFGVVAQFEPSLGGAKEVAVRRFKFLGRFNELIGKIVLHVERMLAPCL